MTITLPIISGFGWIIPILGVVGMVLIVKWVLGILP